MWTIQPAFFLSLLLKYFERYDTMRRHCLKCVLFLEKKCRNLERLLKTKLSYSVYSFILNGRRFP